MPGLKRVAEQGGIEADFIKEFPKATSQIEHRFQSGSDLIQALIKEVFTHYDTEGHDFSQYDNDGDGVIDYLSIIWTGAHGEWAEFWWGYQTSFYNDNFEVDGVRIGTYSWQWENYDWPGEFSPEVIIHETGHALDGPRGSGASIHRRR